MRHFMFVVFLALIASNDALSQEFRPSPWVSAARCTRADADAADSDLDQLKDWPAVYRAFKRYRQCDDASIGEGYSDKIVILLTKQWASVSKLAKLAHTDPLFGQFVLAHVDTLMSPGEGEAIIVNATEHCPITARQFCRRLAAKARSPN